MTFPFPGQVPCRHAAPLSHTFSSMFHVCCTKKEKEETQTCHASRQSMPIGSLIPIVFNPSTCLCEYCVLHTMAFWLNIFGGVPKLTHIRCGVVKACSQVSMTGMQLTMQEAQTSQSLSVYGDYLLKHLVHYFVSFGLRTSHWDCWRIHLSFSSKR